MTHIHKDTCIYCKDKIKNEDEKHFISDCCGRGMCEGCYNALVGTTEQLQLDGYDDEEDIVKDEYKNATYLCFDCDKIWAIKK